MIQPSWSTPRLYQLAAGHRVAQRTKPSSSTAEVTDTFTYMIMYMYHFPAANTMMSQTLQKTKTSTGTNKFFATTQAVS